MKRKQKNRKFIVIAIALLMLISIGYAALSTTLTINGTANISSARWNVYFTNIQVAEGSVTTATAPTIPANSTDTTALTYTVTLDKPGDFYEFTVDAKNGGTINAKIDENGVTKSTLTGDNAKFFIYTVTYEDGTAIADGDKLSKSGATISGIGDTRTIKVRVEYNPEITTEDIEALTGDLTATLNFSLKYVQD